MIDRKQLSRLLQQPGIISYLLLDRYGGVLSHRMVHPEKAAGRIILAASQMRAVGEHTFRHAVFAMENGRSLIVYPLGKALLSIVTDQDPQTLLNKLNDLRHV